jgi:serine protease AprX
VSGRVPTKAELDDLAPVTDNALHNPYPNPCSFETLIRFDRVDPGPVTVAVYDLIGRRIEVLVDDVVAAGSHHVIWRAAGHASGVYVVRYTAGEYANSRKIIVVR